MTAPPAGVLEELDGGPIRPGPVPAAMAWPRAMAAASIVALSRPRLWAFALLAFLARGGLVVLVFPMLVLPTFVGLSNIVGPTSVTAAGPTPRLVALITAWVGVALGAIVVGTVVSAAAEVGLYHAAVAPATGGAGSAVPPAEIAAPGQVVPPGETAALGQPWRRAARRIATVRLALLLPVAMALVAAVPAWVQVAYQELLLPTDLAIPLPLRVIAGAPVASMAVAAAWLLTEVFGGLAARRIALGGSSVAGAFRKAASDLGRAPISILLTLAVSIGGTLLVLVPASVLVGLAWGQARIALVDGTNAIDVIVATLLLVAAWLVCLGVAGIAAAWRSALWTAELTRRARAG